MDADENKVRESPLLNRLVAIPSSRSIIVTVIVAVVLSVTILGLVAMYAWNGGAMP